jgi:hypothetical protein
MGPDSAEIAAEEVRLPSGKEASYAFRLNRNAVQLIKIEMRCRQIVAQGDPKHAGHVDEGMQSTPVCTALRAEELLKGAIEAEGTPSKRLQYSR